jgi:hypothetical protein
MANAKYKKLRFSDVAKAIESTPKALRKMLQNPGLVLPAPVTDGWTEFSLVQIAVLAVARRLIEFGFPVQFASTNACSVLFESILANSGVAEDKFEDKFTADTFLRSISDAHAVVYFDDGQPVLVVKHVVQWTVMSDGFEKRPILLIPIGAVVTRAFERLLLDGEGDMSGSAVSLLYGLKEFRMNASMSRDEWLSFVAEAGIAHE